MKQRIPTIEEFAINESTKPKGGPAAWKNELLGDDFYDMYASADVFAANLSHYMDDMNAGKTQDAVFSLKVAYEEYAELEKLMKLNKEKIKKQLQELNVNVK